MLVIRNLQIELSELGKTKTVLTMSATLVDAIVKVVGGLGPRSTVVSVIKSGSFIHSLGY
jgi:hypothetical protein